jgi:ubiquinone biosynthesis protein COQ9
MATVQTGKTTAKVTGKTAAKKRKARAAKGTVRKSMSDAKSDEAVKDAVLKAALVDAAFDGFTDNMLLKAGKTVNADRSTLARLFPDGGLSLIEYFSASIDRRMENKLAESEIAKRKVRERIKLAVLTRLELLAPNKEAARRAAATLTLPTHAARAAKLMYNTVDAIWRATGDTSTDFNFYTKRAILAGVYGSVLVRWFADTSEDESATKAFLDARIENVMQFEKLKAKAKETLSRFPVFGAWAKPTTEG